ncbi:Beige-like protein [Cyphellophora attinorum]|uniref:Beige-like protein n=1 Tax=Cyphellophora attinorum TaxID=1664694 RepID=A0A0N0NNH0_9EURO|nr:Beige-like protein [Phialophora attinorum]KPI41518.1 Beige-like protein [Phialophora attinorum]
MSLPVGGHGRSRAVSTAIVPQPRDDDISSLVDSLRLLACSTYASLSDALDDSTTLQQLRHKLKDDNDLHSSKGGFRRVGGHQVVLNLAENICSLYEQHGPVAETKRTLQHLGQVLGVLSASLEGHAGNQKFFRSGPVGDGWARLKVCLDRLLSNVVEGQSDDEGLEQLLGLLLAAATCEESTADLYTSLARANSGADAEEGGLSGFDTISIQNKIEAVLADGTELALPEFVVLQVHVWSKARDNLSAVTHHALPLGLTALVSGSRHNLVAAHLAGLSREILPLVFVDDLPLQQRRLWQNVSKLLYSEGASDLGEARQIFSNARSNPEAGQFLLDALKDSRRPSSVQFDLAHAGYSSVELSSLGRPFPPTDSAGYTLSIWARFDDFDQDAHTTLFGAFDSSQSCFVLIYLEKDTHHLILQTAIRGQRPSVRFKSVAFLPNKWYHIALVHKRPRTATSSKAYLFVDGEFAEQQKANYPSIPPSEKGQRLKVQGFLGTPQDLSPAQSGERCMSKWSLASAALIAEALSDDIVAVFFNLGPHYHGNFQDCLGSFQTYKASAALNLRNEMLHPGKEDNSELILAIRQKASDLIAEDRILLSISPATILDSDDRNHVDESQLVKSLSKLAAKNLMAYTRAGSNAVAVNGAIPAINDALTQESGVAMLMGEPTVAVPQPLEDAAWRLGGCAPIVLGLVAHATTTEDLALAVDILFETIRSSWRNSEVMERERGYDILAMLLRSKLTQSNDPSKPISLLPTAALDRPSLFLKLLDSILDFVGYDSHQKDQSVINNPLAYKVLLVDCNLWRCGPSAVRELYFEQFQTFAVTSVHSRFNLRRLARMRVLRRLLEALKSEPVTKTAMQSYADTFRILLPQAITAELLRSMALFITYAVNKRHVGY